MNSDDPTLTPFLPLLYQLLRSINVDLSQAINFYKRYKASFITYHSSIYDRQFNCNSHVISFTENSNSSMVQYGDIILFLSVNNENFAFIQKYVLSKNKMSDYVQLPGEMCHPINIHFPMVRLSNNFIIIPVVNIHHKCIRVPVSDSFCISEIKIDYEHD